MDTKAYYTEDFCADHKYNACIILHIPEILESYDRTLIGWVIYKKKLLFI